SRDTRAIAPSAPGVSGPAEATAGQRAPCGVTICRYAYHWTDGQLTFVATVGPDTPGADGAIARVSRDGSYAAITSSSSIADAPNDDHAALYLYDAGSDALSCASCRPDGTPSGGPANLEDRPVGTISPQLSAPRNLADDGRLYFASADRLLPDDQTDAADVYEYDDGAVSLLSSGTSAYDSYVADNSDDGRSVFFTTRAGLLPQDTDNGVLDLYVARTGGGFPPPEPPPTPCESDACQGLVPPPPSLLAPNSGVTGPSGNAVPSPATPRDIQLLRLSAPAKRRLAHDGASTLPVRISGGGTIIVRATGRLGGRMRTLGSTTRAVEQTGPVTARVRLELSAAARRALRRGRSLRIRIEVRVRGAAERDHTTLTLKRASR
ncbi:MAG TPA: hypothetical protein VK631_06730, partial [Solirubrobacteraceae bacterium]|nr:hypothetical protein [Solirubrobacteraceae bacterium]